MKRLTIYHLGQLIVSVTSTSTRRLLKHGNKCVKHLPAEEVNFVIS